MIAESCLNNWKYAGSSLRSTEKTELLTAAQMWGSGKTWLGENFPKVFKSDLEEYQPLKEELRKKFGEENLQVLQNMVYVAIDFRDFTMHMNNLDEYVKYSLLGSLLLLFPQDKEIWKTRSKSETTCAKIIEYFYVKYSRALFIHFDEVDKILEIEPKIQQSDDEQSIKRFYQFWTLINPILYRGGFLYCSGRSPYLYYLGKGLYIKSGLTSPGAARCILLDTLKQEHIERILQDTNPAISNQDTRKKLSEIIYQRTSGVPRFVYYAMLFLKEKNIQNISPQQIPPNLFGEQFRTFVSSDKKAYLELNPIQSFDEYYEDLYLRMAAVSLLKIPVDPDADIPVKDLGLSVASDDKSIKFLQLAKIMNVYLQKQSPDNTNKQPDNKQTTDKFTIVFPEIVLDEIASTIKVDELPCSWEAVSRNISAEAWSGGKLMECMLTHCLGSLLQHKFTFESKPKTLQDRLPFLRNSLLGNVSIKISAENIQRSYFPKMVNMESGSGGCVPLSKQPPSIQESRFSEVKEFFEKTKPKNKPPGFTPSNEFRCHVDDWSILIDNFVIPNTFYRSSDQSSSGDCMYFPSKNHILMFQTKARKDKLTIS